MKVLILNQHFYPEVAATGQLATDLAEDLAKKGLTVSVVTGMPSYTRDRELRKATLFERYRGVRIYRVITTPFDKNGRVGRVLNYISFYLFALIRVFTIPRHDIVITMSTPPFLSLIGVLLKKLRKMKFFYWVQDLYPDIAIAMGVIDEKGFFGRLCKKASQITYRHADVLVPIGETMADRMKAQGVDEGKLKVIHNWADPEDFVRTDEGENPIREKLGLNGKFVVLYSGNIGVVHEFETVKRGMLELKDDEN
jgi:glycosyltransferase involved in cell wall biosynthesis